MVKDFLKNSFIYTLGTVLTRGMVIFLVPIYTRYLSPQEYGIIDLFMIVGTVIGYIIALEITQAIARYYQEGKNLSEKLEYVSTAFWFTLIMYLFYFIVSVVYSETFTIWLLEDIEYQNIFILASLAIVTNGILYFTQSQLKWQIQSKDSVIVGFINVLVVASIAIYLLVVEGLKLESIFIGQIIGNIIASLIAIYYARFSYGFAFCFTKLKEMISFSSPLVLSSVGFFIAMYIDRIAINDLLGLEELGIYGIAYRFASIAALVMIGFQSSLVPLVYKHYKEENTPQNVSKIFNLFCLFALFVFAGTIIFSQEVLVLLTTEAYYGASSLIAILVLATFFSQMYIFAPGIGIAKKTKLSAAITLSGAVINTILNYTLIPMFGVIGATYATLTSSVIIFFVYTFVSFKYYPIPYQTKKILFSFFVIGVSAYGMLDIFDQISFFSILVKVFYLLLIVAFLGYILLNIKRVKDIIPAVKDFVNV